MSSLSQYACDTLKNWVWSGFYRKAELYSSMQEMLDEEGEQVDAAELGALIDAALAAKHEQEAGWPATTDCERLEQAFQSLRLAGICCLHNAGYTMSDGHSDAAEMMEAGDEVFRGFCFYHGQDVERAIAGDGLMLAFGARSDDTGQAVAVARDIVAALQQAGLVPEWDGVADTRIALPAFAWQRRTALPPSAFQPVAEHRFGNPQRRFRVFYCFYGPDIAAEQEDGVFKTAAEIVNELFGQIRSDGDFVGLLDEEGNTLQMIYEQQEGHYWVEVPVVAEQGSYGRAGSAAEMTELFLQLPVLFVPAAFPGFQFVSWENDEIAE